MQMNRL